MHRSRTIGPEDQKLFDDIEQFGWHCLHILEEGPHLPFSFTVGLFATYGHPDLLIYGLPRETAHEMLAITANAAKNGCAIEPGLPTDALLNGSSCVLVPIAPKHYRDHLGTAIWYYENRPFPATQIVWPSKDALFPWDPAARESFKSTQPILGHARGDA
jgi:Domain of unknown function (DUF4262)